jgi:hypothetical protein
MNYFVYDESAGCIAFKLAGRIWLRATISSSPAQVNYKMH